MTSSDAPLLKNELAGSRAPASKAASCPVCDASVEPPADAIVGEVLGCDECGAELELVALEPTTLAEAPEVEEDWGE